MSTSNFTSNFWNIYIGAIVVLSFIGIIWLLLSQNKVKAPPKGEKVETMGHEWDGIGEYNNPLPRWWFYLYILTWVFGVVYLIVYPGVGDYKGLFGWTSANQYEKEVAKANEQFGPVYAKFAGMSIEQVAQDEQAKRIGKNLFDTYCIQCHGSDAKGSKGFPNLTDTDWIYGGTPKKIQETIQKGRIGIMAPWGPTLGEDKVKDVANFVISLSKPEEAYDVDSAARGKAIFNGPPANCFTCHGNKGQGVQGMGPNLTDDVWLWGSSQKAIIETITNGRHNQMPAWENFLDKDKLHIMTAYVWGLSHPEGKALPTDTENALGAKAAELAAKEPAPAPAQVVTAENMLEVGKNVYDGLCFGCHAANSVIPGAPRLTNNEDWAPRIAQGKETLFKHAIEGFNNVGAMPAKGGNPNLSDDEVKAAVVYMVNQSGGQF